LYQWRGFSEIPVDQPGRALKMQVLRLLKNHSRWKTIKIRLLMDIAKQLDVPVFSFPLSCALQQVASFRNWLDQSSQLIFGTITVAFSGLNNLLQQRHEALCITPEPPYSL
jgi:hypothetical protein